jgi:uncharacterized protein YegJ (DUF2314 family)
MRTQLLVITALVLPSFGGSVVSSAPPDVVLVEENDKEMNAAMDKARKSVEDFVKAFQKADKSRSGFAVKIAIKDGKQVEHFWVGITKFDGMQFEGTINNEPALVKTIKEGEKVKVEKARVEDWMYIENKKLVGGYTVRVLRNRLTPEERKALDDSVPFKID